MFNFQLITLFPEAIRPYLDESILGRAQKAKKIKITYFNPRDFSLDKHHKVDSKPYGGGPGMVMQIEPIIRAVQSAKLISPRLIRLGRKIKNQSASRRTKIIIFSPNGKQFTNTLATKWAKSYDNLILIAGHYEGIDARVKKILKLSSTKDSSGAKADVEEISIGPYILTGGEVPALIIVDAVARQIPGILGNLDSPEEKRISSSEIYTRPEIYIHQGKKYSVPKILLSGHHLKIEKWKQTRRGLTRTKRGQGNK